MIPHHQGLIFAYGLRVTLLWLGDIIESDVPEVAFFGQKQTNYCYNGGDSLWEKGKALMQ